MIRSVFINLMGTLIMWVGLSLLWDQTIALIIWTDGSTFACNQPGKLNWRKESSTVLTIKVTVKLLSSKRDR